MKSFENFWSISTGHIMILMFQMVGIRMIRPNGSLLRKVSVSSVAQKESWKISLYWVFITDWILERLIYSRFGALSQFSRLRPSSKWNAAGTVAWSTNHLFSHSLSIFIYLISFWACHQRVWKSLWALPEWRMFYTWLTGYCQISRVCGSFHELRHRQSILLTSMIKERTSFSRKFTTIMWLGKSSYGCSR